MLQLPSYQQLSREQDKIHGLPLNGSNLIVGPPGTGKTVLAIYRASMLKNLNQKSHFIVYNNTLNQYLEQAIAATQINALSTTYHSWLTRWYRKNFRSFPPQVEAYVYDWMKIYQQIGRRTFEQYDHIIIDEGQDFPREFYIFIQLISKNVTVFADENQKITKQNSTLKNITDTLNIKQPHYLKRNYRNTRPIAEFARVFYAGLGSGLPDLPEKNGPKPRVLSAAGLESQIEFIARYERNNPNKDIAIFVERHDQQSKIKTLLDNETLRNRVQLYQSGDDEDFKKIDFTVRGIKILTYASAKGLEFDAVFIPELEKRRSSPEAEIEQMRFYVLTSRARQELFLLFNNKGGIPPILGKVPENLYNFEYLA